ncbi:MAG: hypothetical protein DM484_14880 [Candidatus Methylumidiphilus alinenensis]|uniref:Uncharacterized protein n=1 Tax=Candidatus Methylumidiphilus alinenensis TaxID=2202197 RepID=A0A2W4R1K9_9GAMM|nr:MAG: hypothetical protein DM484_14880 [Candidatus Methylumidiphilus alinenensis]
MRILEMYEFYITLLVLGIVLTLASVSAVLYAYHLKKKALDEVKINPEKYSVSISDTKGDTIVISPLSSRDDIQKANNIISSVQTLTKGKFSMSLPPPPTPKTKN